MTIKVLVIRPDGSQYVENREVSDNYLRPLESEGK